MREDIKLLISFPYTHEHQNLTVSFEEELAFELLSWRRSKLLPSGLHHSSMIITMSTSSGFWGTTYTEVILWISIITSFYATSHLMVSLKTAYLSVICVANVPSESTRVSGRANSLTSSMAAIAHVTCLLTCLAPMPLLLW